MEAATLPRGGPARLRSLGEAVRARSRAFWIVAGLTAAAALLRFATLGVQSYHHDEVVTAIRIIPGSFGQAMDAVGFSESTPPLYYAVAWLWTQVAGNTEYGLRSLSAVAGVATVPVVYLIALELRGRRAGLFAAALAAFNPMLLWYSQEARAYSLLALLCAVSMLYCFRALRDGRRRNHLLWGLAAGLALATHYFAIFPILAEAALLARRRGRAAAGGLVIVLLSALALAPLAIHQMSSGHAEWISSLSLGHRVWETIATFVSGETGDIIGQPERPDLAYVPLALCLGAFALLAWRGGREEWRAAALPLAVGLAAVGVPLAVALVDPGRDFVLARNLMPGLIPLLVVVAIAVALPSARRLGAVIGISLVVYSAAFCVWASVAPDLQRANWDSVAGRLGEPAQPRAMVTWTIGEAPLSYYLDTDAIQVRDVEGYEWLVHEVDFISQGDAAPPAPGLLDPAFREAGSERAGSLLIRRYRVPGRGLAAVRLAKLRRVPLNFRTTGVLLDGIGPG